MAQIRRLLVAKLYEQLLCAFSPLRTRLWIQPGPEDEQVSQMPADKRILGCDSYILLLRRKDELLTEEAPTTLSCCNVPGCG